MTCALVTATVAAPSMGVEKPNKLLEIDTGTRVGFREPQQLDVSQRVAAVTQIRFFARGALP